MTGHQSSALNVVMGAMTFGTEEGGARVFNLRDVEAILDAFQQHGHVEVDSARTYTKGTSEEALGQIGWQKRGLVMDTKLAPNTGQATLPEGTARIDHSPEGLRRHLQQSLKALNTDKIDMWYLHAPDRTVPYEATLKTINDLHKEGCFKRFGISNYSAFEVAEMVYICRANGWIQPTAYQGIYNALHRNVEPELFPCLRKFGISFYEFNALGGGFFTGRYLSKEDSVEAGTRFDPKRQQGQNYRGRYWNDEYFSAMEIIRPVADKHGLTLAEIALRWVSHHSLMKREFGDSVIIGASSLGHIEQNLIDLEKGPLPDEIVQSLDKAWLIVQPVATSYFRKF